MLAKLFSATVIGIEAFKIEIEVNPTGVSSVSNRDSAISIVGLPDAAVRESRDRIHSAFISSNFMPPQGFTVVNLAPADLKKEGSSFDLGIALGILGATGVVDPERLGRVAVLGELGLDGSTRPVRGALPIAAMFAHSAEVTALLVPEANAREAALAAGDKLPVFPVKSLREAVELLNRGRGTPCRASVEEYSHSANEPDFADVKGQIAARRALEIAAAGAHHVLLSGSPGTGKSMISMRLPGILPPMTLNEMLETSQIHSVLGMLSKDQPLVNCRPFRAPHHTISDAGLVGGGRDPRPGEISLAHNGVLFLDELPEFKRNVLEVLRQPLETGSVTVSRAAGSYTFPARFMLCAAMNPCPCGRGSVELGCKCSANEIRKYQKRISGPMLDRIDLIIDVKPLSPKELTAAPTGESSRTVRERVIAARKIQLARFSGRKASCNADMNSRDLRDFCPLSPAGEQIIQNAIQKFQLSPRAYDRILKVSRTISDLKREENISTQTLSEAISLRKSNFLDPDAE